MSLSKCLLHQCEPICLPNTRTVLPIILSWCLLSWLIPNCWDVFFYMKYFWIGLYSATISWLMSLLTMEVKPIHSALSLRLTSCKRALYHNNNMKILYRGDPQKGQLQYLSGHMYFFSHFHLHWCTQTVVYILVLTRKVKSTVKVNRVTQTFLPFHT